MLKVLIVDDEYLQRELIKASVCFEELNMIVTGEAEDGKQALLLFEQQRPDIVIMDINIPFINGIDVSKRMKEIDSDTQILILTAYGVFDYAKEALHLGAAAFVLKPLNAEELYQKLSQAADSRKEHFLLGLLSGLSNEADQKEGCEKFNILSDHAICVLDIRFDDENIRKKGEELQDYIGEQFPFSETLHIGKDMLVILFGDEQKGEFRVKIYSLYQHLNEDMAEEGIAGSISDIHRNITKLPAAYREAYSLLNKHIAPNGETKGEFIKFRKYEAQTWKAFVEAMPYQPEELWRNMRSKNFEEAFKQIENIYKGLEDGNYAREASLYIAMDILINITSYFMEYGIDIIKELEQEQGIITELSGAGKNKELEELLISFIKKGIGLADERTPASSSRKASDAKRYIEENYYLSELSLNTVSEAIGVNSSYLSNIFKTEFRISLSRYIIKIRMEHAIAYMKENRTAALSEVAEEVGYTDVYYFSKSFKSYYGVTPSKYFL